MLVGLVRAGQADSWSAAWPYSSRPLSICARTVCCAAMSAMHSTCVSSTCCSCCSSAEPLSLRVHSLGLVLRCTRCGGSRAEVVSEPILQRAATMLVQRWDTQTARQEMALATLTADRPPIMQAGAADAATAATAASTAHTATPPLLPGLAAHTFAASDLSHDPLSSLHFVTSFDVYECVELAASLAACETLPPDMIDMMYAMDTAPVQQQQWGEEQQAAHERQAEGDAEDAATEEELSLIHI